MGSYALLLVLAAAGPRVYVGGPADLVEVLRAEAITLIDAEPCNDLPCVNSRVSTFSADLGVLVRREASGERVVVVDSTGSTVASRVVGPDERMADVVRELLGLTPAPTAAPGGDDVVGVDPVEDPDPPGAPPPPPAEPPAEPPTRREPPLPKKDTGCNPWLVVAGVVGGGCTLVSGACFALSALDGCGSGCNPDVSCNPDLNCGTSCAAAPLFDVQPDRPTPTLHAPARSRARESMAF